MGKPETRIFPNSEMMNGKPPHSPFCPIPFVGVELNENEVTTMDPNKTIFIAAAILLSFSAFWTWSSLFTESVEEAHVIMPNVLFSIANNPAQCPEYFVDPTTEGPYYKKGSPQRTDLTEKGTVGEPLTLSGRVLDRNCDPVPGAWLDFWQADGDGKYDNRGYRLRGHQFTDKQGRYVLRTVMPGAYPERTSHIHVKLAKKAGGKIITSQLYFPDRSRNASDPIFRPSMVIRLDKSEDGSNRGYFDFRMNQ
jgi:protocatechuate 3,4-dioxygenase beta subunit